MSETSSPAERPPLAIRLARSPWPRLALLVALLAAAAWFAVTRGASAVADLRDWTARMGTGGAVVYAVVYAASTVALLPATLLSAAAGVLYGPLWGIAVVWSGAVLGAVVSFVLGRALSRTAVEQLAGGRTAALDAFLARRGTVAVLIVRLVPLFPFALVNYGSAVTAVTFRQYLAGTALGILPGTAAYVALGGSITEPGSPVFIAAVAGLVLLAVGGGLAARRLSRPTGGEDGA
jgi:uncharacterized membrane protein YdjX (TVP38/TMEM64 family)